MKGRIGGFVDGFGAVASWACAVHCLLLPFLLGALPITGLGFLLSETAERSLIGASAALALLSLVPSFITEHRKLRSVFLATSGLSLIVLTHVLFEDDLITKTTFLVLGAVLISAAHILNRRLCQACEHC
ncbi:MAG: MerC domain-containing protein [Acidobacteria bacterium]|nr:MAG: MerC domain-containing protein [Acidobacteriota bacterium]REJ98319.1 MAG: MerC domain-containing protein [Acidobacteriota bacterium]REK17063.1 MAG: MerC domain-containing protein [Acidobacteriota bacterium]REK42973.1 MAG: MerC domain-containing protein [Acidobacteriota bacterium]